MALGSYHDFIQSMLGLRAQRLQEERYKQLERMEQQEQMSKMMQGMGKQFGSMAETMGQNRMANQLMAEEYGAPPRAQAVDPSMQGPADAAAARMPGFYTGGMPELKMRMGMAEDRSQADYRRAMIGRMGQNLELQQDKLRVQQAVIAKKDIDKNLDQDTKNENWYIKENRVIDSAIEKATTPEQWQNAVDSKTAVYRAAVKRGMKVDPFDPSKIAPFMSQDDKDALQTQQDAVASARTALQEAEKAPLGLLDRTMGFFGIGDTAAKEGGSFGLPGGQRVVEPGVFGSIPSGKTKAVLSAQQLLEQEQQKLREAPGASYYGEKPVPSKKEGALTETPGSIPVGTTKMFRNKATGKPEPFVWDGSEWVPQ